VGNLIQFDNIPGPGHHFAGAVRYSGNPSAGTCLKTVSAQMLVLVIGFPEYFQEYRESGSSIPPTGGYSSSLITYSMTSFWLLVGYRI